MSMVPLNRALTATALAAAVLGSLYFLPWPVTAGLFALIAALGALEWARLAGVASAPARWAYAASIVVVALSAATARAPAWPRTALVVAACVWWVMAAVWIVAYQRRGAPAIGARTALAAVGWLVLAAALSAILDLAEIAPTLLLGLFGIVWGADIFAYLGGRRWGRRRLASRVSPGKTWEGLASGLLGTLAVALAMNAAWAWLPTGHLIVIVLFSFLAAVVGDLLESLVKRLRGVKDSGTLLPGHGGMLDRIDSLLAAAPVYSAALHALDLR